MNVDLNRVLGIVKKAGQIVMEVYNTNFDYSLKNDRSPLTKADTAASEFLITELSKFNYPVISEECSESVCNSSLVWVVDPLDGTLDFIKRSGEFSIMISLVKNKMPIFGVVYAPVLDKMYYATKGKGAFLVEKGAKKTLSVKASTDLRVIVSRNHTPKYIEEFSKLFKCKIVRSGSIGIKFGMIAEGKADLCFYNTDNLGVWDGAAPTIILKEARGVVTDRYGKEIKINFESLKLKGGVFGFGAVSDDFRNKILEFFRKTPYKA